jgi:hypothetical protein
VVVDLLQQPCEEAPAHGEGRGEGWGRGWGSGVSSTKSCGDQRIMCVTDGAEHKRGLYKVHTTKQGQ